MIRALRAESECFLVWRPDIIFSARYNICSANERIAMMLDRYTNNNFKLLEVDGKFIFMLLLLYKVSKIY